MGAKNMVETAYFKLKKDENKESKSFGSLMFYPQVKADGKWGDGKPVNCIEGYIKDIKITSYEWNGKTIESLNFEIIDNDNLDSTIIFQVGLRTFVAQNMINTLAGEERLGVVKFTSGKPKESNGKTYPTLYINNNNEKTKWKYRTDNNNINEIPRVTHQGEGDSRVVFGQEEVDNFWKRVLEIDVLHKMYTPPDATEDDFNDVKGNQMEQDGSNDGVTTGQQDDLPF